MAGMTTVFSPHPLIEEEAHFKTREELGKNKHKVMGLDGTSNQN
jgi:hypothetical protein